MRVRSSASRPRTREAVRLGARGRLLVLTAAMCVIPGGAILGADDREHRIRRGPLRVHPDNPRYLTDDGGRAIYLTGSHTWLSLQDAGTVPAFDYDGYLDFLEQHGHNFIRLWNWEGTTWVWSKLKNPTDFASITPAIFARTGPGVANDNEPKSDLSRFNQEYFDRLRERVIKAGDRGIYVGVKFFEGFSVAAKSQALRAANLTPWLSHPFHAANNISGVDGDPNGDGDGYEVHTLAIPQVTRLQEAYVRKVIDTVNDLDNVVFEICNEAHGASTDWQYHWIDFIREYEQNKPKQHLIWMSFQYDGRDMGRNEMLFHSGANLVSPGRHKAPEYETDPPPADGSKVVLLDTDHINPRDRNRVAWTWMTFTRGMHPLLMDDPFQSVKTPQELAGAAQTRSAMGQTRRLAERVNLAALTPTADPQLCSTTYCLHSPGVAYIVFQPHVGPVLLRLVERSYDVEWIHPVNGLTIKHDRIHVGSGVHEFRPPVQEALVLYLHESEQ